MSQLQNCIVMFTNNGSYCENEKKRKSQGEGGCLQRIEVIVKRQKQGGCQGRCERRSEAFVKIQQKMFFFCFFLGGGGGGSG